MNSLTHLLAGGSVSDAVSALESAVKTKPADAEQRAALTQLLCLSGDWARAKAQLKVWQTLKPIAQPTTLLLTQAVEAEMQRLEVFNGTAEPQLFAPGDAWIRLLSEALRHDAQGDTAAAEQARDRALEEAPAVGGTITLGDKDAERSEAFAWLMDGDGRLGPLCELLLNGRYYWLPFDVIAEIRFQAPQSVTDLIWSHVLITLTDGREQVCQLPARYPLPENADDALLLGKRTEWLALGDGPHYCGLGQKSWLSDSAEYPLHTLRHLRFGQETAS